MPTVIQNFIQVIRLLLALTLLLAFSGHALAQSARLESLLQALPEQGFKEKEDTIAELEGIEDERVVPVLKAMLEGDLYGAREGQKIVFVRETDGVTRITEVLTGDLLEGASKGDYKKITVNNRLRRTLRAAIARLSLNHKDAGVRMGAVKEMMRKMDEDSAVLLREQAGREQDADVSEAITVALALVDIESSERQVRLDAVESLHGKMFPEAKLKLNNVMAKDDDGKYLEPDAEVLAAAKSALSSIATREKIYGFIETTFFGLSAGSVLLLIAIGLAITFGVMGVINMAHGELMMLGAYTTYVVQLMMPNYIDMSLFVAIPLAFIIAGLVGIAIERGVIRFLYGRTLETLLATFGISLVLQQAVRSIFSPLNRSVETPSWMSGSWEINGALSLTYNRLYIIVFSLAIFVILLLVLKKTRLGLHVRAVSQNRAMARAMGVRSEWVDAMTFGLGSGIAGVAGVALSQLTNVGPNLGQGYIIDSFMVVVFGGVGNLWGTLVGALSLGVVNKYLEPWSGAVLAKILVLVFIILFIQKRPRGLFPQKGRAAEN